MDRTTQTQQQMQEVESQLLPQQAISDQTPVHQTADLADSLKRVRSTPPSALNPSDVKTLQRTVGNQAVQRLLSGRTKPISRPEGVVQRHTPDVTYEGGMGAGRTAGELAMETLNSAGDLVGTATSLQSMSQSLHTVSTEMVNAGVKMQDATVDAGDHPCEGQGADDTQVPATGGV